MTDSPTIIFFGTPQFSVPALKSLIESDFTIASVITQPDKRRSRGKNTMPSPVKKVALENNIPTIEPEKITEDTITKIKSLNPDLFVIVAYGKILPQKLLNIPSHGSINIHPSILPLYRGPSPLQAQILDGVIDSGVSIMLIDEEMDHGPILKKVEYSISKLDTYETLGNTLFEIGAKELPETIEKYLSGKLKPQEQDHSKATFCKLIKKEEGSIDWQKPADYIERMIRAYTPWPSAYTIFRHPNDHSNNSRLPNSDDPSNPSEKGSLVKILQTKIANLTTTKQPGTFFTKDKKLYASAGKNTVLEIIKIQPAGKSPMPAESFIQGYMK